MNVPARTVWRAATAAAAAASALAYPFLPERVATHFDVDGRPDGYSSRAAAAVTAPVIMAALPVLSGLLGDWPGGGDREDAASGVQARDEVVGLVELGLLPVHLAILARGAGLPVDMSRLDRAIFGTMMVGIGNVLPTLPRSALVGIRTPWTLADPTVWERTHRLGGYLLTAAGVVSLASLPATGKRADRMPLVAGLAALSISTIYSLVAYTRRPRINR
jgi:uncharacterized membrane protein